MNIARVIVLGIAIVTAGLAAYLVRSMSNSQGPAVAAQQAASLETKDVLVATRNIGVGERLAAGDFRWQQWPVEGVHGSFIIRAGNDARLDAFVGTVARTPIVSGEPMTNQKIVKLGEGGMMSAIIEPGMRAVGIKISTESGAGGFILPNDRVDVIVTREYRPEGARVNTYDSSTVLRDVRVLAIDQTFREEDGQQVVVGRTATLELTPDQSETLSLGVAMGEVSLALRSLASDGTTVAQTPVRDKTTKVAVVRNARPSAR